MKTTLKSLPLGLALAALIAASAVAQTSGYSCTAQPNDVLASLAMTNGCGIVRDQLGREVSGCCFIAPEGAVFDGPEARVADAGPAREEAEDAATSNEGEAGNDGTTSNEGEQGDDGTNQDNESDDGDDDYIDGLISGFIDNLPPDND